MPSEAGPTPAIRARGLGRRFGAHWALAHVDLDIETGEMVLLAGSNGSGKTTLLRLLSGLLRPSSGSLRVCGLEPQRERTACRQKISLVSHLSYLYPQLTARETVELWTGLRGTSNVDAEALLARVRLESRGEDLVQGFSAGMRKRLSLLRTVIEEPEIVLLDEPFAALDPSGQELIAEWVQGYRERGLTVVLSSHALARAAALCDRAVVLQSGQLHWLGPAEGAAEQVR
ncbi:MAG: heme ABC exporter ATP-binding protein CcmA [Acidobacteriota bacterium]